METSEIKHTHGSNAEELAKPSESTSDVPIVEIKKQHEPNPAEHVETANIQQEKGGFENSIEPTRYGDWEIAGRCVDF